MKIFRSKEVKHKVGEVYKDADRYFMLVEETANRETGRYALLDLESGAIATGWYKSLEELDEKNSNDILVSLNVTTNI